MAASLAVSYPERTAALVMHSGIPALGATDVPTAMRAMTRGDGDGEALGAAAIAAMGSWGRGVPVLVLHGAADQVVAPSNANASVRQWTVVNGHFAGGMPVEQKMFPGIGHAWSGGSPNGTFTAPIGPDATAMILEFLVKNRVISR